MIEKTGAVEIRTHDRCSSCRHCSLLVSPNKSAIWICRAHPPKVTAMLAMTPDGPQWLTSTAWPQVAETDYCGEFANNPN